MNVMPFGPGWGQAKRTAVSGPSPVSDLLYQSFYDTLPGWYTFTRSSSAWGFNSAGVLTQFANDVSRQVYDPVTLAAQGTLVEPSSSNQIANPRCEGAVAPSTPPTGWAAYVASFGMTATTIGTGAEDGIPYLDVRCQGTTTASASIIITFSLNTAIAALTGQTWTASAFFRLMSGSFGSPSLGPVLQLVENNSSGGFVAGGSVSISPTSDPLRTQRAVYTRTLSGGATVAAVVSTFRAVWPAGQTIDFTIRIGLPQMEQLGWASSPIMPPAGSPAVSTRAADSLALALPFAGVPGSVGWTMAADLALLGLPASTQALFGMAAASGFADTTYAALGSDGAVWVSKRVSNAGVASSHSGTLTIGTPTTIVLTQDTTGAAACVTGGGVVQATYAGYPSMVKMVAVGAPWATGASVPVTLRRLRLWPRKLSDAELQGVAA